MLEDRLFIFSFICLAQCLQFVRSWRRSIIRTDLHNLPGRFLEFCLQNAFPFRGDALPASHCEQEILSTRQSSILTTPEEKDEQMIKHFSVLRHVRTQTTPLTRNIHPSTSDVSRQLDLHRSRQTNFRLQCG